MLHALPHLDVRHRRLATIGAAVALAAGALLSAGGAVRSADWADRTSPVPDPAAAHDDRTRPRLEAAATALMSASFTPWGGNHPLETDNVGGGDAAVFGARIMPARLIDPRRPMDREQQNERQHQGDAPAPARPPTHANVERTEAPEANGPARAAPRTAAPGRAAPSRTGTRRAPIVPLPPRRPALEPPEVPERAAASAMNLSADSMIVSVPPSTAPDSQTVAEPAPPLEPAATTPPVPAPLAAQAVLAVPAAPPAPLADPSAAAEESAPTARPAAPAARRIDALLTEVIGIGAAFADELPPAPPQLPAQSELVRLVRTLSALQDDMARGSGTALNAQTVIMRTIAEVFTATDPNLWREAHNARSLALYALSGGSPEVVRAVIAHDTLNASFEPVVAGALAYLEGRAEDARRHFGDVDPATLDPSLEGPFFLAHAALRVESDSKAAMRDLDAARFASPGSLVEEAALRRAILIAAETDDVASFERLVNRYLRRFRESVYAGNFRRRLAAAVTRMTFVKEPGAFDRLDEILEPMTPAGRQELYLLVSRTAVESGSRVAAALAAERAAATAAEGTLDAVRARLYRAAALVVDPHETDTSLDTLRALQEEDLPADDAALLSAALELGGAVIHMPDLAAEAEAAGFPEAASVAPTDRAPDLAPTPPEEDAVSPVETRALELLGAVDLLLSNIGGQP